MESTDGIITPESKFMTTLSGLMMPEAEDNLFQYKITAHRPFGALEDTLKWCRSNIAGEWRWTVESWDDNLGATYNFYFIDEFDCLTFTIRWS